MKTQMEITANEIATRLVQGINRWNQQGAELKQRLLCLLEVEISFLSFENEVSKQMFSTSVLRTLAANHATHYRIVYPPYIHK